MTIGLLLTALVLGLRHGIDWDHIAAIADLSGTADNRRHGFALSLLYALGHGAVVFVLGAAAILAGRSIPERLDDRMGYAVGATLVLLGGWIVIDLVRRGRSFRLRSRWMLVLDGSLAGLRAVRSRHGQRVIAIDHHHPHRHGEEAHREWSAHDHAHDHVGRQPRDLVEAESSPLTIDTAVEPVLATVGERAWPRRAEWRSVARRIPGPARYVHSHRHHHELALPTDAGAGRPAPRHPGSGLAAGVGMLHGIGVESPTQIAIFVASTSVAGAGVGLVLLAAWVGGLIIANCGLAALAGLGLLSAERNFAVYVALALAVAAASIIMGTLLLTGLDVLPSVGP